MSSRRGMRDGKRDTVCVCRPEKKGKERHTNTHNDRILRREQGPVDIAGSGPGRDASMRRKRGERSATHPQLVPP